MGTKEYHKAYYQANKDKWKTYNEPEKHNRLGRESYARNAERLNKKKQQWDSEHFEWVLWSQTKRRAAQCGIEWDLKVEDIVIPETCPYLETPLTRIRGQGIVWTNASVDRIDNSRGYTKDNIMIISRFANSMKQNATLDQLKIFARNTLKLHDNSTSNATATKSDQQSVGWVPSRRYQLP